MPCLSIAPHSSSSVKPFLHPFPPWYQQISSAFSLYVTPIMLREWTWIHPTFFCLPLLAKVYLSCWTAELQHLYRLASLTSLAWKPAHQRYQVVTPQLKCMVKGWFDGPSLTNMARLRLLKLLDTTYLPSVFVYIPLNLISVYILPRMPAFISLTRKPVS